MWSANPVGRQMQVRTCPWITESTRAPQLPVSLQMLQACDSLIGRSNSTSLSSPSTLNVQKGLSGGNGEAAV